MRRKQIPVEALINLQLRLDTLSGRSPERRDLVEDAANLYGVSKSTLYLSLRERSSPDKQFRIDRGQTRKITNAEMKRYCEVIAALKYRSLNKKKHHLSTSRIIEILENHGVYTPDGLIKLPAGVLTKSTVNRYLKKWNYNLNSIIQESPAVRFQAEFSNDCWQFDLSPSDLKHLEQPPQRVESGQGNPTLMLYSVVDDASGCCYMEYHCVYGEDAEAALRFLFNAMSVKTSDMFLFRGIPKIIYMDNGPISRNKMFLRVMSCLGIEIKTHLPKDAVKRKTSARAKGKVERAFRTVKDGLETLYHFHKPETETEANLWLHDYLTTYNNQEHREGEHSRIEYWLQNHPPAGLREMCTWERFSTFAREPARRTVDAHARVGLDNVSYEVEPNLAGQEVTIWRGLFDNQIFVENDDDRFGPYNPVGVPLPFGQFRKFKKGYVEENADHIMTLANKLDLPRSALLGNSDLVFENQALPKVEIVTVPFQDPDPYQEFSYPSSVHAKRAIADFLGQPLTKLLPEEKLFIEELVAQTLNKRFLIEHVQQYFQPTITTRSTKISVEEKEDYVN